MADFGETNIHAQLKQSVFGCFFFLNFSEASLKKHAVFPKQQKNPGDSLIGCNEERSSKVPTDRDGRTPHVGDHGVPPTDA